MMRILHGSRAMAQHNNIAEQLRHYTRVDFTALRYKLNRLAPAVILNLYNEDDLDERGINTPAQLMNWLDDLRDHLVERARISNPQVSRTLEDARRSNSWSKSVVDFIIKAGESDRAKPRLADAVSVWFKPVVSKVLLQDGIRTVEDLKRTIEQRGTGWYRPIPRIGAGKATALERWVLANQQSLGALNKPLEVAPTGLVELGPETGNRFVPLERVGAVSRPLDGSQGRNRNQAYCLISAKNDLAAIQAYLYRFRGRDKTLRAYQKELERFLLWCVCVRRMPMSDVLTDECEAFKDFLAQPALDWVGPKAPRTSTRWRPFEGKLSPASQRYAVQALRSFFEWLVRVRYLGGNPWVTVADPVVEGKELALAIDKALPERLWEDLVAADGWLARASNRYARETPAVGALSPNDKDARGAQYRLATAAILLMGHTGIRREEAAGALRNRLKPVREAAGQGMWELQVIGKRKKWRTVFMPTAVVEALKLHWADRAHDFSASDSAMALLSPVVVMPKQLTERKHILTDSPTRELAGSGFTADGLYRVVKETLVRLADDPELALPDDIRVLLRRAAPHALRHTFATRASGNDVPLDVLQRLLGHSSPTITSIYVQAERTRSIEETAKFFEK